MNKYFFKVEGIERELIILLSIVTSSESNNQLVDKFVRQEKILSIHIQERFMIQEMLISSSIQLRMIDDQFKEHNEIVELPYEVIGNLCNGKLKQTDLNFREACNKVIHAKEFDCQDYSPMIKLRGEHGKSSWSAELDIEKFVCNGLSLIKYYDEDWDISSRH